MTLDKSLLHQIKRHVQTTTSIGGLATKLLWHRDDVSRAQAFTDTLGGLKGPVMKVAQILSTIPDMLPSEYVEALSSLQSKAPPMGWLFVKRRLKDELGSEWQTLFGSFEKEATHAASLGQVHKATDFNGNSLAVKVQYPDMASVIDADLQQLKLLLKLYEQSQKSIQTEEVFEEIAVHLRQELDYRQEAKFLTAIKDLLKDHPDVCIPTVDSPRSTKHLLTMEWIEGHPLTHFELADESVRNHLAKTLFKAWYTPLYKAGLLHGDPHLGNYTATPNGQTINLFDFGCVRVFDPAFIEGILILYDALQSNNRKKAADAYALWGFQNLSNDLIETLNLWATYLYDPLLDDRVRFIHPELNSKEGQARAKIIHEKLKALGGATPPRTFVFMDRVAVGLGSVFLRLKAKLNWHDLFQEVIQDFQKETFLQNQKRVLGL
jgi:predicted unusual protein kinase regulating ubiquinone biosynthesis (AarF/ABC1/UbiB family)